MLLSRKIVPRTLAGIANRAYSADVNRNYDIVVVGGGIVGTASAREILLRHPALRIAIVEKEPKLAFHQSGHNSGVIHAGIYYKPGSLKAKLCVEGLHLSYKYLDEKSIPYKKVGKLIVATNPVEVERLNDLYQRSLANNVPDVQCHMVRGNIYPVPDPRFPFLGVHFTPRMDGSVWLGPNAVLAFRREGYKWSDINVPELIDALRFPGFIKMASKFVGAGMMEIARSALIPLQVRELQKFIPDIHEYDVARGPAGVRAQALDNDGNLVDDFVFDHGTGESVLSKNILHCRNAPSPGATSSLSIAKMIADKIEHEFHIGK
uniref:L-2-hydroxyglutarate dehydrogenase, mitochondrial n=1 Tax=Anopheles coluzzii TaxID=1518534 RepID=A0A8W7PG53_ANOCL